MGRYSDQSGDDLRGDESEGGIVTQNDPSLSPQPGSVAVTLVLTGHAGLGDQVLERREKL